MKKLTIITPCFNEEHSVLECYERLLEIMQTHLPNYQYEHIFADNSSTDNTVTVLRQIALKDKRVKLIVNSRNVGPFGNIWNAMKRATGDAVVPMLPADLQDPPEIIPLLVERWEKGDLIVFGVRKNRQEIWLMRVLRHLYYELIQRFSTAHIPLHSGEFLIADRRVVNSLLTLKDQYPYLRGLFAQCAVRSSQIEYTWEKRQHGKSKNDTFALIDQAINGFVATSRIPARISLFVGFLLAICSIIFALITVLVSLTTAESLTIGIPATIVGVFFLGGIQLFFLGLIGEYVLSIHGQVRPTPPMFEIEHINFDN